MWFLTNIKLVLGSVTALAATAFFFIFKSRGKEIEEQREEIRELKREEEVNTHIKVVTEETSELYRDIEIAREEAHDLTLKELLSSPDKPLPPSLLSKLRNIQGLSNSDNNTPQ